MFKGVEAEVDDLIDKGFGEESLMRKFRKDGAKGIRELHFKEIIKDSGEYENMPYDPSKKTIYQNMPGTFNTETNYEKLKSKRKASGGLVGGQKKLDKNKDGKISGADFAMMRKNYAYGGRVAKMSAEKS
tara:strand:+ start:410 stop:799 length:390 start_codon:yes stop_codon:yes gene_type:complete